MVKKRVKTQLRDLAVRPSKQRGQNFVIDASVIETIVSFGAPQAHENVVEIGPGLGALTEVLAQLVTLRVVEIEGKFCEVLRKRFPMVQVVEADVRCVDFSQFGTELVVFGNLPYVYSSEILFHLIGQGAQIKRAVFLLQKEFAERLAAAPGGRDYGALSVLTQVYAKVRLGPIIGGECFHPPTTVESQLIELVFYPVPRITAERSAWFRKVVKACFLQRRKKIINSLTGSHIRPRAQLEQALSVCKIDASRRAETLSLEEFLHLSEVL